jgi:hypothetical protein
MSENSLDWLDTMVAEILAFELDEIRPLALVMRASI